MNDFARAVDELRYVLNKPFIRRDKATISGRQMQVAGSDNSDKTLPSDSRYLKPGAECSPKSDAGMFNSADKHA